MGKLIEGEPVEVNPENKQQLRQHKGDRLSLFITNTFGSISFLFICAVFFAVWICWNLGLLKPLRIFDPFPFPALEMVVSIFAIILSVSVLISQKRQARMESIRQEVEFEVNIHAEKEITKMLEMLHDIHKALKIENQDDELEGMKQELDINKLHEKARKNGES
ncbi:DUF1003 domain-containing protein [Pedobacter sp. UYP1]|uniref:DUF1003 domain-containing protein n=1 Tax=Pedobacter sp. UYP1 TaxID=1756396 RepID=UPI00339B9775